MALTTTKASYWKNVASFESLVCQSQVSEFISIQELTSVFLGFCFKSHWFSSFWCPILYNIYVSANKEQLQNGFKLSQTPLGTRELRNRNHSLYKIGTKCALAVYIQTNSSSETSLVFQQHLVTLISIHKACAGMGERALCTAQYILFKGSRMPFVKAEFCYNLWL